MNTKASLLMVGLLGAVFTDGLSQTTSFTRVIDGDLVNDPGNFVGAAWGDFDNDGFLDVFLSHYGGVNAFYRNDGRGGFAKIIDAAPVRDVDAHTIPAWGDYDNNGHLDLLVPAGLLASRSTKAKLYRNDGDGQLIPVSGGDLTAATGYLAGGWVDYDNDGFLDLFISSLPSRQGGRSLLFHGQGDGTFTTIESPPLTSDVSVDFAQLWADFDNDTFADLVIVNNRAQTANLFYRNNRDGTFTRLGTGPIATDRGPESASGGAWGDYDNDGFLDLFIATSAAGPNRLYRNTGDGSFTKINSGPMLLHPEQGNSVTCAWGDFDNDGYLDLFVANDQAKNRLFHNDQSGNFTEVLTSALAEDGGPGISHAGTSWVDYDNDGFLDLLVLGSTPQLYHNGGNANGWIEVRCVGAVSNRQGIGAKVRLRATIGGKAVWQMREIRTAAGFNTAPLIAHFGLGDAANIDVLRIEWPSGMVQERFNVPAKQTLTLTEPPRLSATLANEVVRITLKGGRGLRYRMEASSDLRTWSTLGESTIDQPSGTVIFTDPAESAVARRFYRGIQVAP